MDRIAKFLKRLDAKERENIRVALKKIQTGTLNNLDVKKLKGKSGLFRVRTGSIRIVFVKEEEGARVVTIDRRSEDTYRQ